MQRAWAAPVALPSRAALDSIKWIFGLGLVGLLSFLFVRGQFNVLLAAMCIGTVAAISLRDKATAALLTIAYLFLMGDIRRIVSFFAGPTESDPLLLVGPVIAILIAGPIFLNLRINDSLSKTMLVILVLMFLQIFNPKQGGLTVGLSGALFYIVPMLWFWIGRRYATPEVVASLLYRVIFPLAVLAAVLGITQTFVGFLPYQQAWIDAVAKTYTALHVGGAIRAFGFSISSAEYAVLMVTATTAIVSAYLSGHKRWVIALPVLLLAIVLASQRTIILKLVLSIALAWSLRRRSTLSLGLMLKLALYAALGLGLVIFIAARFLEGEGSSAGGAVSEALAHQAGGLAHPLDDRYSTANIHRDMLLGAIVEGFVYPIGHGLGSTTLAAAKFGGDTETGTSEMDFGDTFISLGLVGGVAYLVAIALSIRAAFAYLRRTPRFVSLPVLAILVANGASWLIGGQYSSSCFIFFLIGALVYQPSALSPEPKRRPAAERLPGAGLLKYGRVGALG